MLLTQKKTLLERYRPLRQLIRETILTVKFKKQETKGLKKNGVKNECKDNSSGKRRGKLTRKKRGNGYQEVI